MRGLQANPHHASATKYIDLNDNDELIDHPGSNESITPLNPLAKQPFPTKEPTHDNTTTIDESPKTAYHESVTETSPNISPEGESRVSNKDEEAILANKGRHRVPSAELRELQ